MAALILLCSLYFAWAEYGHFLTGEYLYPQLDPDYKGPLAVVTTTLLTFAITGLFFFMSLGLQEFRDYGVKKAECDRS
jgi:hypothetical protein